MRQHSVSSLPMRNWNSFPGRMDVATVRVYPAYLWGIETMGKHYECLFADVYPAYLWGIETGGGDHLYSIPDTRIQPTYEELKQYLAGSLRRGIPVSSLPMRNWNPASCLSASSWKAVSSLPMRNWNQSNIKSIIVKSLKYPAYLWGIETPWSGICFHRTPGIQPTYEELKPLLPIETPQPQLCIQPTYEELKQKIRFGSVGTP